MSSSLTGARAFRSASALSWAGLIVGTNDGVVPHVRGIGHSDAIGSKWRQRRETGGYLSSSSCPPKNLYRILQGADRMLVLPSQKATTHPERNPMFFSLILALVSVLSIAYRLVAVASKKPQGRYT